MIGGRPTDAGEHPIETRIGQVLGIGTLIAVILLAVGSLALLAAGRSPLDPAPALDLGRLADDLARVQPAALLWLGLLLVVMTPAARVVAALVGYLGGGERGMAVVAVLILVVIAAGVAAGTIGA
ncbi:MAG TPA: DUF1634 domain-containing protein [Candidatus Limnocylindrales bacterium]|nr:DUF1634 domain-containing protein [Candidatus Limnocylindrales bacterium]